MAPNDLAWQDTACHMLRHLMEGSGMEGGHASLHAKKNPGGRPPERGEAKRSPISMRTTPTIRAALEEAADRGGRSLAQEIEQRLERSVADEAAIGGPRTANFLRRFAATIVDIEERAGGAWHSDWAAYYAVREAAMRMLSEYRPEDPTSQEVEAAHSSLLKVSEARKSELDPGLRDLIKAGLQPAASTEVSEELDGLDPEYRQALERARAAVSLLVLAQAKGRQIADDVAEQRGSTDGT